MKYYFENIDSEGCYPIDYFREQLEERQLPEMKLHVAVMVRGEDFFWCDEFNEVGESGESCGKQCDCYSPRNGKNGRCRHHKNCYEPSDEIITIKLKSK